MTDTDRPSSGAQKGPLQPPSLDGLSAQERRDIEEQLLWGVMRESQAMSSNLEQEGEVWSYAPRKPQSRTAPFFHASRSIVVIAKRAESTNDTDNDNDNDIKRPLGSANQYPTNQL